MKIGILVPSVPGHLNPSCCLGKALQEAGHDVSIISMHRGEAIVKDRGLGFEPISPGDSDLDLKMEEYIKKLSTLVGKEALEFTAMITDASAELYLQNLSGILAAQKFDALLIDEIKQESMSVAELHNVPYGIICNALPTIPDPLVPHFVTTWQPFEPAFLSRIRNMYSWRSLTNLSTRCQANDNFRARNQMPKLDYMRESHSRAVVSLSQCPSYLDFSRESLPPHFCHTVPWHALEYRQDVPFDLEGQLDASIPLIYASLGTLQNGCIPIFVNLIHACAQLDVQLVLSLGRKGATLKEADPLPPNVIVVDYCPQLQVLKRASVLVTHAGQNTALEGLAVGGLPMLAIPITNDQPGVAARMVRAGVARLLQPSDTTVPNLRRELQELLENPSFGSVAKTLQKRLRTPTLKQIAELVGLAFGPKNHTPDGKFLRSHPEAVRILGEPTFL